MKLKPEDKLTWGKYKGDKLKSVITYDPDWIFWALTTIEWFEIGQQAEKMLYSTPVYNADGDDDDLRLTSGGQYDGAD